MKFTTKDQDNDNKGGYNCATVGAGKNGWWHNNCAGIHPNHQYKGQFGINTGGIWHSFQFIEMKIRPSVVS